MPGLIGLLVTLLIWTIIFGVIWLIIGWIGLPDPAMRIAKLLFGLIVALILISVLLGWIPPIHSGRF